MPSEHGGLGFMIESPQGSGYSLCRMNATTPSRKAAGRPRGIVRLLLDCLKDDSGQALTEYAIIMLIIASAAFYLYYPHNGLYKSMRDVYDKTILMLTLPGP